MSSRPSAAALAASSCRDERAAAGVQERLQGAPGLLRVEVEHAAEVAARAAAAAEERAGRALDAGEERAVALELEHPRIGGAEDGQRRHAQAARDVHGPAVVGHEGGAAGDEATQGGDAELAGEI